MRHKVVTIQNNPTREDLEEVLENYERRGYVLVAVLADQRKGTYLIFREEGT